MKAFWILLMACWLTSNDVGCARSNETNSEISESETSSVEATEENTFNNDTKQAQSRSSIESVELCPCYPKGRAPVFQNQDLNQFGVKRLVIYLYYSDLTKQLEMHVPNQDKQKLIPDLYEDGDILETVNLPCLIKTFNQYIDLNKDKALKRNKPLAKIITTQSDVSFKSDSNSDESVEKLDSHNKPTTNLKVIPILAKEKPARLNQYEKVNYDIIHPKRPNIKPFHQSPAPKVTLAGNKRNLFIPPHSTSLEFGNHPIIVPSHLKDNVWNYPLNGKPKVTLIFNNWRENQENQDNQENQENQENHKPQGKLLNINSFVVPSHSKDNVWNHPLKEPIKPFDFPERIKNKNPEIVRGNLHEPKQYFDGKDFKIYPQNNEGHNQYTFIPWSNNRITPAHLNGGNYFIEDNMPKRKPQTVWHGKEIDGDLSLPIDNWLQKQIKQLHNPSKSSPGFDIRDFRNQLMQILLVNNITLSSYGYIVDGQGQFVDINNLRLQPILIGRPFPLQQVLKNNILNLPYSPYLKAVLLTTTHPTRLLGTIPLGETYLPSGVFTYSGEVDHSVHDYNVPKVPVYNLKDDHRKYFTLPQRARNLNQPRTFSKKSNENNVLATILNRVVSSINFLNHERKSKENGGQRVSQDDEHRNKSSHFPHNSNQTDYDPPVIVLKLNNSKEEHANKLFEDKGDIPQDDKTAEDVEVSHLSNDYNAEDDARTWRKHKHPKRKPSRIQNTVENYSETAELFDNLQLSYIPGFRIIPGQTQNYNFESLSTRQKPINSEIYKHNVDSNDSLDFYPGFRIIGGHAATSSGAPLSNKGRSGYFDDSISNDPSAVNL